ncbi:hypothetical protein INT48_008862 [Thamnidium elegans]|uniref:Uncharacterized protein n=1 Tax=Thamnidium elegans TaxID=101142 RepID=A0A8H7SQW9_9FUNG|nr:hypothetical protein INT48_008862 [Thamnidium elegans]
MRTSIAIAIVAAAATAVSADCNPSYNVPTSTPCFTACNVKAGSAVVPGWTMDSSSENFLPSLKLMCTKNVPAFTEFMTVAGTCMMGCAGDDPELFNAEFAGACAWYASHKDDACATETTTTAAAVVTTTTSVAATTTVAPGATTGAPVVSPVSSGISAASSGASVLASSGVSVRPSASVSPSASSDPVPSIPAEGAANKLQISGLAMALVAGAGYLAL